jgi:RNA-directed DNA polymerase
LWKWSTYRHSNKNHKWIKKKYFKTVGGNNWVFTHKGTTLTRANNVKIVRHVKIKADANPYSNDWEMYFEKRRENQMLKQVLVVEKLRKIWSSQKGRCLICNSPMTKETQWDTHHIVKRSEGGADNISNLVMLHPNCHRQVHSLKLKVSKPCS